MKKTVLLIMIIGLVLVYGKMSLFAQDISEKVNIGKSIDSSIEKIKSNERFKPFKPNSLRGDCSFTRNISGWSEPMLISTNPGGNQYPSAVLDNDGNIWVSWANNQIGNGLQEPVYVSSYNADEWDEPTIIDSVGFYESNTSMTVDNSGNVWIAWETYNPSGSSPGGDIGAKYFDGNNWSSKMFVPMPSFGFVNAVPNLAVDGTGNTWVTWQHRNDRNQNGQWDPEDDFDIYSNYYDGVNWLIDPIQVSTDSLDDWWNSSTVDNEGNIWAGWCSARRGEFTAYSSCNNGTGWSPDVAVVPELGDSAYAAEWIDMATDINNNVWMTYQGYKYIPDFGEYIPTTVVTYHDGNSWTPVQFISSNWQNLIMDMIPNIYTDNQTGYVWVTWTGIDLYTELMYIYLKCWNGNEWLPTMQVTDSGLDYVSEVVIDNSGRIWVIWTSLVDGENNIYAKYNDDWVNVEENNPSFLLEDIENFPNPFNSTTTISFSVEDSDKNINITIYNFNGQKIKTLINKKTETGTHEVVWDGTNDSGNPVPAGIYFYKMEYGDKYSCIKKMILMK